MKIACIGGGPAGLYFSILMKKMDPNHDITVYERNRPYDTFGWGVVFSDETLQNLDGADEPTKQEILDAFAHWDDIDVVFKGRTINSGGHGFCGIQRKHLLNILQARCEALDVKLVFEAEIEPDNYSQFDDCDLVIACDGINSKVRTHFEDHFKPEIDVRRNRFIWLGTKKMFDAFTFIFENTDHGWFQAHAYRFNREMSTFIVETTEEAWKGNGIDQMSADEGIAFCETLFKDHLDGNELITNAKHLRGSAQWINFPRVSNETWIKDNWVLMGDAAHTAHYSIGSGTKLALEDAISLAQAFEKHGVDDVPGALQAYEAERKVDVLKIQSAARNSTEWFENIARYEHFEPEQFAYSLLTRSQRISHENLRLRDKEWLEGYEHWVAEQSTGRKQQVPVPPMFTPFKLRDMDLPNRIVVSPMATYSAKDGLPNDFHLVHLGSRAQGGAGLVFTEMTCVSPEARITPGCPGIYTQEQADQWKRIVDFVHANSPAKICLQLGHAGPKGSTKLGWEGMDKPLDEGNWPIYAASPVKWDGANQEPIALDRAGMDKVVADFRTATQFAVTCGFDMIELHAAHGYLLASFISPLINQREDAYGGSIENRAKFPLEVFHAMREIWPAEKPMSVRISATDWHPDGLSEEELFKLAQMFKDAGVDLIDVSAGQTSKKARPVYGRMFQTPYSDKVRNDVGIATMAVGNIYETDHANSIIAAGRADLTALARPHLADPYWALHAAAKLNYDQVEWPKPYLAGRDQYVRNLEKATDMAIAI